jgi:excinuclease UvrABC nuclease subunit
MHRFPLDQWRDLPDCPGIYQFFGGDEKLLYIGKSVHLRQRVRSYLRTTGGHSTQTARLKFEAQTVAVTVTGSELAALLLENRLIKEHLPPFNRAQRRWRHYPFLRLDLNDPFPRLEVTRDLVQDGAEYFGPYRDAHALYPLVQQVSMLLGLRTCQSLEAIRQGCLLDQMERCCAPCRDWVTPEQYRARLEPLRDLLLGAGAADLLNQLNLKMARCAEAEQYEQAARWRDRHKLLSYFVHHQSWRTHQAILDACAVYPTAQPQEAQVFWIKGGRLLEIETITAADIPNLAQQVAQHLAHYGESSPNPSHLPQHQLDEFQLLATWLYRHGQEVIWIQPDENLQPRICQKIGEVINSLHETNKEQNPIANAEYQRQQSKKIPGSVQVDRTT